MKVIPKGVGCCWILRILIGCRVRTGPQGGGGCVFLWAVGQELELRQSDKTRCSGIGFGLYWHHFKRVQRLRVTHLSGIVV